MARINKRSLTITIGGTEYSAQVSNVEIDSAKADSDFQTFADAAGGGARAYTLQMTIVQDPATGTLWDRVWSAAGTTVACTMKPFGAPPASVTTPWYTFNATIVEPDGTLLGGEADESTTAFQTIEVEWPVDAKPTKVTA